MISSVGVPAVISPMPVLSTTPSSDTALSDGASQRTSLKIRSHSQVRTTDDGQLLATSKTKLRFRYDFEAADGTKIRIRAEANLNYAQLTDSDEQSQSLKLRATARISILQEGVSSDLSPLLNNPENSTDAKSVISTALDLFHQVTDTATSLFLNSDPLDGDSLITGVAEAFNGLSESLTALFQPSSETPTAVPSTEAPELLEPPVADPAEVVPAQLEQSEAGSPVVIDPEPLLEMLLPATAEASEPEAAPVEDVAQEETAAPEAEVLPEADAPTEAGEVQNTEPAANEPTQPLVREAMFRVRLRVMESLRSLVGVFDSDSSRQQVSQSMLRVSAQFSARYSVNGSGGSEALPNTTNIDAQV